MQTSLRHYTLLDRLLIQADNCLNTIIGQPTAERESPAARLTDVATLSTAQRTHSSGLMRVNHSGEVCAQALYYAQALVARDPELCIILQRCAHEETDHLAWCQQRLDELQSHRSYLNLLWYCNSFLIGIIAGLAGDRWSLGFIEETETQVSTHLQKHLDQLTTQDPKSSAVIQQMQRDEEQHAALAREQGAQQLPRWIKLLMTAHAKVMTTLAFQW